MLEAITVSEIEKQKSVAKVIFMSRKISGNVGISAQPSICTQARKTLGLIHRSNKPKRVTGNTKTQLIQGQKEHHA